MVEMCGSSTLPLAIYLKTKGLSQCTGISFTDSTTPGICHNRIIHSHKVFDGICPKGSNVDHRKLLKIQRFIRKLFGKLFDDKGYISKQPFQDLFFNGLHLITKLKRNIKSSSLTPIMATILLQKRVV